MYVHKDCDTGVAKIERASDRASKPRGWISGTTSGSAMRPFSSFRSARASKARCRNVDRKRALFQNDGTTPISSFPCLTACPTVPPFFGLLSQSPPPSVPAATHTTTPKRGSSLTHSLADWGTGRLAWPSPFNPHPFSSRKALVLVPSFWTPPNAAPKGPSFCWF